MKVLEPRQRSLPPFCKTPDLNLYLGLCGWYLATHFIIKSDSEILFNNPPLKYSSSYLLNSYIIQQGTHRYSLRPFLPLFIHLFPLLYVIFSFPFLLCYFWDFTFFMIRDTINFFELPYLNFVTVGNNFSPFFSWLNIAIVSEFMLSLDFDCSCWFIFSSSALVIPCLIFFDFYHWLKCLHFEIRIS